MNEARRAKIALSLLQSLEDYYIEFSRQPMVMTPKLQTILMIHLASLTTIDPTRTLMDELIDRITA